MVAWTYHWDWDWDWLWLEWCNCTPKVDLFWQTMFHLLDSLDWEIVDKHQMRRRGMQVAWEWGVKTFKFNSIRFKCQMRRRGIFNILHILRWANFMKTKKPSMLSSWHGSVEYDFNMKNSIKYHEQCQIFPPGVFLPLACICIYVYLYIYILHLHISYSNAKYTFLPGVFLPLAKPSRCSRSRPPISQLLHPGEHSHLNIGRSEDIWFLMSDDCH